MDDNRRMDIHTLRYRTLRAILESRQMSLRALANIIDRSESQTSSFAGSKPSKNIGEKMARHIEDMLQLPRNYLDDPRNDSISHSDGSHHVDQENAAVLGEVAHLLPVVGMTTAGNLIDNIADAVIEEYVPAPGPCTPEAFVLRLEGVSMLPSFQSGDRIVIDPGVDWMPGDFVFARRITGPAGIPTGTFKQLALEDGEYYLCASNPEWSPRYMKVDDEWQIVGKARYQVKLL